MEEKKLTRQETLRAVVASLRFAVQSSPWYMLFTAFEEVISRLAPFANAFVLGRLVSELPNVIDSQTARQSVVRYIVMLAVISVIPAIIGSIGGIYRSKKQIELDIKIRRRLQLSFAYLPYAMYEDKQVIDAYDRASQFANRLSSFAMYRLRNILGSLFTLVVAAIAFWNFSPWLTLIIFVLTVPMLWFELRLQALREKAWRRNTLNYRKSNSYNDLVNPRMIKETRLLGLVGMAIDKAQHYTEKAELDQLSVDRLAERYRVASLLVSSVIEVMVLLRALQQIVAGRLPIGQFVFVQQVASQYLGALREVGWMIRDLDDVLFGVSEYDKITNFKPEPEGEQAHEPSGDIVVDKVAFTYPQADSPALKDVSLTIKGGQTVAIVGENGAGKTTLVKLIMKLYDPSSGGITIGGQPLQSIGAAHWHRRIGTLFQDFRSFYDFTIRENVWFGDTAKKPSDPQLEKSLRSADAYGFASKLPKGLDTYLGKYMDEENGTDLSGGEAQRLAIARTLFRAPDILILDEPTSAVDAKAEYKIFEEIERVRNGRTAILISHRFSTVRKADYIFVLQDGKLLEQGTHEELLKNNKLYREMFDKQAEGYR